LKIHSRPVPVLGGAAVVAATLLALALTGDFPATAVVAAAALALAGGTADDLRPLRPARQLVLQAAVAAIVLAAFDPSLVAALGLFALVVACTNAVNVVDGQDGLAGGLGAISATGLALCLADTGSPGEQLGLVLAGALCAFLAWNRPPARIFLGNGGAYAVGTLLAALAAMLIEEDGARGIAPAVLCLGVFFFDLAFTVVRRMGTSELATGDRMHSYDLLSAVVNSRGWATLAFWAAGGVAAGGALLADAAGPAAAGMLAAGGGAVGVVCGRLLWLRRDHLEPSHGRSVAAT
jgi:UDP-GlcNAc:undecaprenyl-phosphate GlcNAc-1-phosphate transferase